MIIRHWKGSSLGYIRGKPFNRLSAGKQLFHLIGQSAENNISEENAGFEKNIFPHRINTTLENAGRTVPSGLTYTWTEFAAVSGHSGSENWPLWHLLLSPPRSSDWAAPICWHKESLIRKNTQVPSFLRCAAESRLLIWALLALVLCEFGQCLRRYASHCSSLWLALFFQSNEALCCLCPANTSA